MSVLAKRVFLTFALFASLTCALWIVVCLYLVFTYHGPQPHIGLLLPVFVFGGAAAVGFKFYYDERRGSPTFGTESHSDSRQNFDGRLLTTPVRAGVAVSLTALVFVLAIRDALHPSVRHESLAPFSFMLHGAALMAVNVAFWGYVGWLGFCFIRSTRGRERVVMIGWAVSVLLTPLEWFWPEGVSLIRYTDIALLIAATRSTLTLGAPFAPSGANR
jgi:hypothetical protein